MRRKSRFVGISLFAAGVLVAAAVFIGDWKGARGQVEHVTKANAEEYYTCPMHPSVISDRPGACPVCGMALVKKTVQNELNSRELAKVDAVRLSATQRVTANVSTTAAERRLLVKEIFSVGVISVAEPRQSTVAARFRGRIEAVHVDYTGDVVRKGEPLFDLYSPDLVSALREYVLAKTAATEGPSSAAMVDVSRDMLQAARDRLRVHFGLTDRQIDGQVASMRDTYAVTFFSPISGTVLRKEVQEGQYVDEGMVLYELADLSRVWIYLDVYERDIRHISKGQAITVVSEAYPGETFGGRITFVDPVLNPETRTVRVRTEFENREGKLRPNMFVTARLRIPIPNALVVPASAVLNTGRQEVVWIEVGENTFVPRQVTIGARTESFTQVLRGLGEGDRVVVTGGYLIDSESELRLPATGQHAGHGAMAAGGSGGPGGEAEEDVWAQPSAQRGGAPLHLVPVVVKGRYFPDSIHVHQGERVRLKFYRDEDADCTNEVVFESLNIRRRLPARETTTIEFLADTPGEISFACGMGMIRGKIIVEP
jgi:membrane fusion protein, copper/silver efflux system